MPIRKNEYDPSPKLIFVNRQAKQARPTRRHADTPTRRHADTPTRRHALNAPVRSEHAVLLPNLSVRLELEIPHRSGSLRLRLSDRLPVAHSVPGNSSPAVDHRKC